MTWLSPRDQQHRRTRRLALTLAACAVLLLVSLLDHWAVGFFASADSKLKSRDWYQMFRQTGYWPTWILIGLALALFLGSRSSGKTGWRLGPLAGFLLIASAGLSGLAAELLKLFVGRMRPGPWGIYEFKPFLSGFINGSNLGMASSHTAVAFGAAFMILRLFPAAAPVALFAATGCALTRLLSGAHFLSDVTVAAMLAYAVSTALARAASLHKATRKLPTI
mgnify:CR=1 FL=1